MRYTWFALFWSIVASGSMHEFHDQSAKFRFFLVLPNSFEGKEIPLAIVNGDFENFYLIYDDQLCYGFFKCLAPYIFSHADNPNRMMQRFLHVQTGECFDVEPLTMQEKLPAVFGFKDRGHYD